jgi:uncharacterized alpha-E superfamily protein
MLAIFDDVALEEIPARDRRHWVPIWRGLLEATGHGSEKITARANPHATLTGDLNWRMTLSVDHPSSIASSIEIATENARQLRDNVSPEAWVLLSRLATKLDTLRHARATGDRRKKNAALAVQLVLTDVNAFLATAERTMLMDAGWEFLRMGLHLERAIMTCSALRHVLGKLDEAHKAATATSRSRAIKRVFIWLGLLAEQATETDAINQAVVERGIRDSKAKADKAHYANGQLAGQVALLKDQLKRQERQRDELQGMLQAAAAANDEANGAHYAEELATLESDINENKAQLDSLEDNSTSRTPRSSRRVSGRFRSSSASSKP